MEPRTPPPSRFGVAGAYRSPLSAATPLSASFTAASPTIDTGRAEALSAFHAFALRRFGSENEAACFLGGPAGHEARLSATDLDSALRMADCPQGEGGLSSAALLAEAGEGGSVLVSKLLSGSRLPQASPRRSVMSPVSIQAPPPRAHSRGREIVDLRREFADLRKEISQLRTQGVSQSKAPPPADVLAKQISDCVLRQAEKQFEEAMGRERTRMAADVERRGWSQTSNGASIQAAVEEAMGRERTRMVVDFERRGWSQSSNGASIQAAVEEAMGRERTRMVADFERRGWSQSSNSTSIQAAVEEAMGRERTHMVADFERRGWSQSSNGTSVQAVVEEAMGRERTRMVADFERRWCADLAEESRARAKEADSMRAQLLQAKAGAAAAMKKAAEASAPSGRSPQRRDSLERIMEDPLEELGAPDPKQGSAAQGRDNDRIAGVDAAIAETRARLDELERQLAEEPQIRAAAQHRASGDLDERLARHAASQAKVQAAAEEESASRVKTLIINEGKARQQAFKSANLRCDELELILRKESAVASPTQMTRQMSEPTSPPFSMFTGHKVIAGPVSLCSPDLSALAHHTLAERTSDVE